MFSILSHLLSVDYDLTDAGLIPFSDTPETKIDVNVSEKGVPVYTSQQFLVWPCAIKQAHWLIQFPVGKWVQN